MTLDERVAVLGRDPLFRSARLEPAALADVAERLTAVDLRAGCPVFLKTYEKGFQYAERGLKARYPAIEERLAAGVDLKDAATLVDKPGIGLLYWYSTNLGSVMTAFT